MDRSMISNKHVYTPADFGWFEVLRDGKRFAPTRSLRVINHSPCGFAWGYGGSGPAQFALALLLDVTGDKDLAMRYYQAFKWDVVAKLPDAGWELTSESVLAWVEAHRGV